MENRKDLLKTLCDHKCISNQQRPVVNLVHAVSELEDFMEACDDGINFLNEKRKNLQSNWVV